jgi:hypothetical protein
LIGATMTGAEITPPVEGVQAIGIAVSWIGRGETMRTLERSIDQPRPNSKPSLVDVAQAPFAELLHASTPRLAAFAGELVRRGPITSARCSAIGITWLRVVPSSMMRITCVLSSALVAAGLAASGAVVVSRSVASAMGEGAHDDPSSVKGGGKLWGPCGAGKG